ncbi:MAG: hypothetical protein H6849_01845 [Alphaproteobacteria bacterium]|nr:MAG: hypothetical protein H6849_01845 [Alphaproteobacteria bacterium]
MRFFLLSVFLFSSLLNPVEGFFEYTFDKLEELRPHKKSGAQVHLSQSETKTLYAKKVCPPPPLCTPCEDKPRGDSGLKENTRKAIPSTVHQPTLREFSQKTVPKDDTQEPSNDEDGDDEGTNDDQGDDQEDDTQEPGNDEDDHDEGTDDDQEDDTQEPGNDEGGDDEGTNDDQEDDQEV